MQLWQSGFWFIFLVFFFVIVHLADFVCVVGAFCFVLFCFVSHCRTAYWACLLLWIHSKSAIICSEYLFCVIPCRLLSFRRWRRKPKLSLETT